MYNTYYDYTSPYSSAYSTTPSTVAGSAASTEAIEKIVTTILGLGLFAWLVIIALAVLVMVARWIVFKKANIGGWESLIPVHNGIVELQLGGVQTYWYFLNLIVICGIGPLIYSFWKSIALAKSFGKGTGFGVLLAFFPFVCYPILAFGNAQYVGPQGTQNNTTNSEPTVAE